ncbi:MAG: ABC transporter ATP-binding protein/permease [Actinobacteria bacterium]|nr:ABC transporter ATP-binding protein/permease [Actinomycetota bacterium]
MAENTETVIAPLTLRRRLRALRKMAGIAWRADRAGVVLTVVFGLVASASIVRILAVKAIVEAAVDGDTRGAAIAVGILATFGAVDRINNNYGFQRRAILQERNDLAVDRHLMEMSAGLPGLEHHERPEFASQLELLRQERGMLSNIVSAVYFLFESFVRLIVSMVVLASVAAPLALLPLFAVPSIIAARAAWRIDARAKERLVETWRRAEHVYGLATTPGPAKEARLFGLREWLPRLFADDYRHGRRTWVGSRARQLGLETAGRVFFGLGFVAALVLVASRAAAGQATAGDVVVAFQVAGEVSFQLATTVNSLAWFGAVLVVAGRYLWLTDYAERTASATPSETVPVPEKLTDGIRVENVDFTYPGTDRPVLTGADLFLPAGSTVAVVGDNGAGKTTLVKLLCGFYEPTAGRITVDGVDIAEMELPEWRKRMSAGFQDFVKFELLARESVGVGELDALDDVKTVEDALHRAAADDVVPRLAEGLETQLGRSWTNGAELSGGQWQKLALGRAMMRSAPLLLVLDEPTASLDPDTEHALFERYAGAARRVAETNGAITVLVSHRFSTVRMADLIVVVNDGRIVESGSHQELVQQNGLYAELYNLQARAYA